MNAANSPGLAAYGSEFNPHNGGTGLDSPGLMPPR
jgi:hypothetical protein